MIYVYNIQNAVQIYAVPQNCLGPSSQFSVLYSGLMHTCKNAYDMYACPFARMPTRLFLLSLNNGLCMSVLCVWPKYLAGACRVSRIVATHWLAVIWSMQFRPHGEFV